MGNFCHAVLLTGSLLASQAALAQTMAPPSSHVDKILTATVSQVAMLTATNTVNSVTVTPAAIDGDVIPASPTKTALNPSPSNDEAYHVALDNFRTKLANIVSVSIGDSTLGIAPRNQDFGFNGANIVLKRDIPIHTSLFSAHEKNIIHMNIGLGEAQNGGVGVFIGGKVTF